MRHSAVRVALTLLAALTLAACGPLAAAQPGEPKPAYTLTPSTCGMVLKAPDGRVVFEYLTRKPEKTNLAANSVCCFHPVNTPSGERVTDLAPGDHRHHRGVFLAWHTVEFRDEAANVYRGDFWGWGQFAPTEGVVIQNREVNLLKADADQATVTIQNAWTIGARTMLDELASAEVRQQDGAYVIDLDYRLMPVLDMMLGQTAFGGFCVRARNDGESYYATEKGKVELPNPHHLKPETNWPASDWCDYTIKLESGKTVGVAVINHPKNPPYTWHNPRTVWMLNPCIVPKGPVAVKAGEVLALRYRLVVHDGPTPAELLGTLTAEWRKQ